MTSLSTLPPVAQRTYTDCKKCGCERFHVVVAHTSPTAAKLECEVCKTKRTLKLENKKLKKTGAKGAKKVRVSAGGRWEEVKGLVNTDEKQAYNMKKSFTLNCTIDHPKFGIGVVTAIAGNSMEVVFEDGTRSLVHNRA
jgi:hypothetical protein